MKSLLMLSGVGGQGVMSIGELFCGAAAKQDKIVTFAPTYGAEKRGGRTMCQIVVSDKTTSPIVSKVDVLMVMDERSLDDYIDYVKPEGVLIINSNAITCDVYRDDIRLCRIPFNDLAVEVGNAKCANMIALGAVMRFQDAVELSAVQAELPALFPGKKQKLIPLNEQALARGYKAAEECLN